MGVRDLWKILAPVGRKATLFELSRKKIAIDLSCWICENQIVGEKYVPMQSGMHLRNVFFRTSMLLMIGVTPVFVLDGKPPELKKDVLSKRKQARYKQQNNSDECKQTKVNGTRSRLKFLLKQCKNMLEMMGLKCLESDGEGEALCAQLNRDGIVDGVITSDSDVFLYGARTVYRNFTLQGSSGSVEIFEMDEIEKTLNLTCDKLVALSLMCGCDYDDHGVHGVGKEKALRYFSFFKSGEILNRLRQWRTDKVLDKYETQKTSCTKCSHQGKLKDHNKSGCIYCGVERGCVEDASPFSFKNLVESEKEKINLELFLRKRALENSTFPEEEIITEFLMYNQNLPHLSLTWRRPKIENFIQFTSDSLDWELNYAFKKILPLSARWQILNDCYLDFKPEKITKKKVLKGIPSFEILWSVKNENITVILDHNDLNSEENVLEEIITVEPQALVVEKLRALHQNYLTDVENEKIRKKEEKKGKSKNAKSKKKDKPKENQPKIDSIIKGMTLLSLDKNKGKNSNIVTQSTKNDGDNNYSFLEDESATSHYDISDFLGDALKRNMEDSDNLKAKEKFNQSVFCADCDDSTVDYEIDESFIVDTILARKQFY